MFQREKIKYFEESEIVVEPHMSADGGLQIIFLNQRHMILNAQERCLIGIS